MHVGRRGSRLLGAVGIHASLAVTPAASGPWLYHSPYDLCSPSCRVCISDTSALFHFHSSAEARTEGVKALMQTAICAPPVPSSTLAIQPRWPLNCPRWSTPGHRQAHGGVSQRRENGARPCRPSSGTGESGSSEARSTTTASTPWTPWTPVPARVRPIHRVESRIPSREDLRPRPFAGVNCEVVEGDGALMDLGSARRGRHPLSRLEVGEPPYSPRS